MLVHDLNIRKIFATTSVPTIEVELVSNKGTVRSSVPIGTSTGRHEVVSTHADRAIRKFSTISHYFKTERLETQEDVDLTLRAMDKSPNFRELGGNLALAISSAFFKAFALDEGIEIFEYAHKQTNAGGPKAEIKMPMPICNMVGGWNGSDIQEFLLFPAQQVSFLDSISVLSDVYHAIKEELKKEDTKFMCGKNIESAWVTSLNHESVLELLKKVAEEKTLKIGLDFAASGLWKDNKYNYKYSKLSRTDQLNFVTDLAERFPIAYIEDPFEEDDFVSHSTLTHRLSGRGVMVCGDDLYTTDLYRLKKGIEYKATNTVIVKPNQIGTITDAIKFVQEAKKSGLKTVMSHRSGETEDTLISHLAVGLGCDYIKLGISGERTTKINEMIRIEERSLSV